MSWTTKVQRSLGFLLGNEGTNPVNRYLTLLGISGLALWLVVQVVTMTVTFEVTGVAGITGLVIGMWLLYSLGHRAVGQHMIGKKAVAAKPFLLWSGLILSAYVVNLSAVFGVGNTDLGQTLMWLPWAAVYALGYLGTYTLVPGRRMYLVGGVGAIAFIGIELTATTGGFQFLVLGILHLVPLVGKD